ncbi:UNVERIFIED_CONTAM: hypothetical protein Slati_4486500 [Sesamum latifolium]|uniref:Uncharacterized protein n=1 Tax=Sesamum latifolium TaxID=2727402 RepID=A0AAW2SS13_9LAMI
MPPTSASGGSTPAASAPRISAPGVVGPVADPPRRSTSSDTSTEELSPALLGAIYQIVSAAIREQVAVFAHARVATPSEIDAPEEEAEGNIPVPIPQRTGGRGLPQRLLKRFLYSGLPASSTFKKAFKRFNIR